MQEFKSLVYKLEKTTEGHALLDAEIAVAVFPDKKVVLINGEPHWTTKKDRQRIDTPVPQYTRSLDAALPWEDIVGTEKFEGPNPFWRARQYPVYQADAATEALARRTAALKQHVLEYQPKPEWPADKFQIATGVRTQSRFVDDVGFRRPSRDKSNRFTMQPGPHEADKQILIDLLVAQLWDSKRETQSFLLRDRLGQSEVQNRHGFYIDRRRVESSIQSDDTEPLLAFSAIFEAWLDERKPGLKNRHRLTTSARRLIEFHGDRPVDDYSRTDIRQFFNSLWDLPKFVPPSLRRLPMPAILEYFADKNVQRVTVKTVAAHQKDLQAIFNWAQRLDLCQTNPAAGFRFQDKRLQSEKRLPFSEADLKLIFEQSPLYAGCQAPHLRKVPGDQIVRDSFFWLPLVAIFSGARLSEIGLSVVDDYQAEDGIHYLNIHLRRDQPHLKSQSADRQIPIHPELVKLGFLDWVESRRKGGWQFVFCEMYGRKNIIPSGANWSHVWMSYQRDIGITDHRKVFHSFRHTFKRACRSAGLQEEVHDAITGHRPFFSGRGYGGPVPLQVTAEAIKKVRYNFDLSGLYQQACSAHDTLETRE